MNTAVQTVLPPNGELNEHCRFKLSGYHQLICQVVETELATRGQSIASCVGRGFAWALTSITMDVLSPISSCDEIKASTWISTCRPPYTRREVLFSAPDGSDIARISLYSVPLDIVTRGILSDTSRIGDDLAQQGDILIPDAKPRISQPSDYLPQGSRQVYPNDIDALGHMNNCRYGAMIYDALTADERMMLGSPFRYVIDFRRQLSLGESVDIEKCSVGGDVYIRGLRGDNGKESFSAHIRPIE